LGPQQNPRSYTKKNLAMAKGKRAIGSPRSARAKAPSLRGAPPLLILGASARAAAFSAARAGFAPIACDIFGDDDLRSVARYVPVAGGYPEGIARAVQSLPPVPWIYTGGIENHPALVASIARTKPLWGASAEALRRVRDPSSVERALARTGARPPAVRPASDPPRRSAGWLWKPLAGAGGRGIRLAVDAAPQLSRPQRERGYFQRRVPGVPCSAVFVGRRGDCDFLGATRQLVGVSWLHAKPFAWCGNVGPIRMRGGLEKVLRAVGEALAQEFQLVGLFGVDFLLDRGVVRPVEVNPRYPASVEVLELALGISAIALHAGACAGSNAAAPTGPRGGVGREGVLGKAVVYAPSDVIAPRGLLPETGGATSDPWRWPRIADVPRAGTRVPAGTPLLTVFARGRSVASCRRALRREAEQVLRCFRPAASAAGSPTWTRAASAAMRKCPPGGVR